MPVCTHTHLHLNVQKSLTREHITADMERLFASKTDSIGACELETPWHHREFKRCAVAHGYAWVLPDLGPPKKAGSALGLAVRKDYGEIFYSKATFAAPGKSAISPTRYVLRARVRRHVDDQVVMVNEHHAYSSGWTGPKSDDALRQLRWKMGWTVVTSVNRRGTKYNDLVVGGGDINRPPWAFKPDRVLGALMDPNGMKTAEYAHTDATHGTTTFDYVWALSTRVKATFVADSTPAFNSDHDGVLATVSWGIPDQPAGRVA